MDWVADEANRLCVLPTAVGRAAIHINIYGGHQTRYELMWKAYGYAVVKARKLSLLGIGSNCFRNQNPTHCGALLLIWLTSPISISALQLPVKSGSSIGPVLMLLYRLSGSLQVIEEELPRRFTCRNMEGPGTAGYANQTTHTKPLPRKMSGLIKIIRDAIPARKETVAQGVMECSLSS